jgi:hypothetical protein
MRQPLEDILRQHPVWRGRSLASPPACLPTGFATLDAELPGGGWPTGGLTEILCNTEAIGELGLLLPALSALTSAGKRVVWLAPPHLPYAPALAAAGVDLTQLVLVRAPGRRDALWAAEQVLRAASCHALLAWLPRVRYAELRRLAVAAEAGRAFVALWRSAQAIHESTPACLRLALEPAAGALAVRVLKRRGMPLAAPVLVPVKRPVHALGCPASARTSSGQPRADRRLGLPVHA